MGRVSGWFIEALFNWRCYLFSQVLVAGIAGVGYSVRSSTTLSNHIILYLLAVVVTAVRWGRGPAIVTAISSTLVFDYFFVPPYPAFGPWEPRYLWTLISLLVVGLIISTLTGRLRARTDAAQQRELEMTALYQFSRDLAAENQVDRVAEVCARHLGRVLECEVAVFLDAPEGLAARYVTSGLALSEDDRADAARAYDAECSADLHRSDRWSKDLQYLLLKTPAGKVGALGVRRLSSSERLPQSRMRLVETLISQAALAIERALLQEKEREAALLQERVKLQKALLDSISHDLRTPLASITGAMSILQDDQGELDAFSRQELLGTARQEAERLNRIVGNLLDMTRLEAGALQLTKHPCDVQEIIGSALSQFGQAVQQWPVTVTVSPDLPFVQGDFMLLTQVLANVLDNAMKYSSPGRPIEIRGAAVDGMLELSVSDHGVGIPASEHERVFEKFYRVERKGGPKGSGLGLSICKGFVEAHGGRIRAENGPEGGTRIVITLPVDAWKPAVKVVHA